MLASFQWQTSLSPMSDADDAVSIEAFKREYHRGDLCASRHICKMFA